MGRFAYNTSNSSLCLQDLSAPQRCNAERSDAQRNVFTSLFMPLFLQCHRCDALPCFSASPVIIFYIAHIAFPPLLPNFPFATMVYCTKQQEIYQESQRSDVATGNAGWLANANANAAMRCTKCKIVEAASCWKEGFTAALCCPEACRRFSVPRVRAHTKGVMQPHATLRRVLRRFSTSRCFLEGFLEGAL